MQRKTLLTAFLTASYGLVGFAHAERLSVGMPAPALDIEEWVQGAKVELSTDASKKLHLVEFWATWCPPCKASVPKLSEIQDKYKDNLTIIGVTDPDNRGNTPDAIRKFVKSQGKALTYTIAIDKKGKTYERYMEAAGESGIPHCFLVGKDGKIIWTGSPLDDELGQVIDAAVKGTYDANSAKLEAEVNKRFEALAPAFRLGKWDIVVTGLKDVLKLDPANELALDALSRVYVEEQKDVKTFRTWFESHVDQNRSSAKVMSRLALTISGRDTLMTETPDLALQAARGGYEAASPKEMEATVIYARVLYQIGAMDRAISVQTEAVALANGEDKDMAQKLLDYYQKCKQLQGSVN